MKIFIICSKKFYGHIPPIKDALEIGGHIITLPNSYDDPSREDQMRLQGNKEHSKWKASMLRHSAEVIGGCDAVLVLNFEKSGLRNYIGGATFLEMYDAFRLNKTIYLYNDIPEGILRDEIVGFNPVLIDQDLSLIKN